jgi:antitoxin (DNA-binding transcriptional repressor) of toxin-antitoxin stability system
MTISLVMIMTMLVVNVHEAKARLSEFLDAVGRGERVVICRRNQPVAELRAVEAARTTPRPVMAGPHRFDVSESFFAPLSDEMLGDFEAGAVYPERQVSGPARVAEGRRPARRRRRS